MFRIIRFKLSQKIFLSFLLIIIAPSLISLLIGYSLIKKTLEHEVKIRLEASIEGFNEEIQSIERKCLNVANELSGNGEIRNMLIQKEYDKLEKKLVEIYRLGTVDIIELEDTHGQVLLRGHNPGLAGDIKVNQDIVRKGLEGKSVVSYERGKSGFAVRAVSPIQAGGKTIGLIMAGNLFSEEFVNHIKDLTGMESAVYKGSSRIISTLSNLDTLDQSLADRLEKNEMVVLKEFKISGEPHFMIFKPLFLEDGSYWGGLAMAVSRKEGEKFLRYSRNMLFYMISAGILIALFIYILLAKNIHTSLRKIITGINSINMDNFSTRIDIKRKDEFGSIADSLNQMVKKIQLYNRRIKKLHDEMLKSAKLTTAGQIAAGIAHEIRNPLSSIKMMVQVIGNRYMSAEGTHEIGVVLNEIDRIDKLVKELLEYSKPSPMQFIKTDLHQIIKDSLYLFQYKIKHQGIEIRTQFQNNLPPINLDPEKIQIVFINIIINAFDAMTDGGELSVKTKLVHGNELLVQFCNTGKSIPKGDLDVIFEPFFTTKKEGTGLGLALVKMVIERHFGRVDVKSGINGTCFSIFLPVQRPENIRFDIEE